MLKDTLVRIGNRIKALKAVDLAIGVVFIVVLLFSFKGTRTWLIEKYYYHVVDSLHNRFDQEYFWNKGVKYQETHRNSLSIKTFERVIRAGGQINPFNLYQRKALYNIGVIYYQMAQENQKDKKTQTSDYEKAKGIFVNYLKWFPPIRNDPEDLNTRQEVVETITFIDSRNDPSRAKYYKDLGQKEYYNGNYKKAIEYYLKAVEIDPTYDIAYNNIGSVYYFIKDYRNAIKYWEQAVVINPKENQDLYLNIGGVYKDFLTNYQRSIYFLKKHLEMNPNDPQKPNIEYAIHDMENKISSGSK
jgi:tetratricopeptide (TPR) repeat protein